MITKTIQYKNFLGEDETEKFYFNLSKGELVKMQMAAIDQHTESFTDKLEKITKNMQGKMLIEVIDEIVESSYGVKTTDGKRFVKNADLFAEFKSTGAYSELIVELCTDAEACAAFINGLVPAELRDQVNSEVEQQKASSQTARERSAAQLQGFQKKQTAPKPTVEQVPELPTVIEETADPVLETSDEKPKPKGVDLASMSREDLLQLAQSGALQSNLK